MVKPTYKSPGMNQFIDALAGETDSRANAIKELRCIKEPLGCGQPIGDPEKHFKDTLSLKEYRISGLCQKCQDHIFGAPDDNIDYDGFDDEPAF